MQRAKANEDFRTLRDFVDHRAWGDLPPTVVTAFYEASTNAICESAILASIHHAHPSSISISCGNFTNALLQQRRANVSGKISTLIDSLDFY
jgi:hypothetical protein